MNQNQQVQQTIDYNFQYFIEGDGADPQVILPAPYLKINEKYNFEKFIFINVKRVEILANVQIKKTDIAVGAQDIIQPIFLEILGEKRQIIIDKQNIVSIPVLSRHYNSLDILQSAKLTDESIVSIYDSFFQVLDDDFLGILINV